MNLCLPSPTDIFENNLISKKKERCIRDSIVSGGVISRLLCMFTNSEAKADRNKKINFKNGCQATSVPCTGPRGIHTDFSEVSPTITKLYNRPHFNVESHILPLIKF